MSETTATLTAFHGDPAIKAKYLARVEGHILADSLVRGVGWEDGRGCAIGCTLEAYDHARYPVELGIPEWLARLEDTLFEGMSLKKSRTWPRDFLAAIRPGDDLERIKAPFLVMVLQSALETFDHARFPEVKASIDGVISIWQRSDIGSPEWERAAAAAAAAARAAAEAAWAAARAAWAAEAAEAAAEASARASARASAEASARASARASAEAEAEAEAAARAAAYDHFADHLIQLLKSGDENV